MAVLTMCWSPAFSLPLATRNLICVRFVPIKQNVISRSVALSLVGWQAGEVGSLYGHMKEPVRMAVGGRSFPPRWNVSPTSTVRTIWRAGPGRWSESKAMTGVAIVIPC